MGIIFKYWVCLILLLRNLYDKKLKDRHEWAAKLAGICLSAIGLFYFVLLEYLLGFKGLIFVISSKRLPWAPIASLVSIPIILVYIFVINSIKIKNRRGMMRQALLATRNTTMVHALIFGVFTIFHVVLLGSVILFFPIH
jgi:hypothetical protein